MESKEEKNTSKYISMIDELVGKRFKLHGNRYKLIENAKHEVFEDGDWVTKYAVVFDLLDADTVTDHLRLGPAEVEAYARFYYEEQRAEGMYETLTRVLAVQN